MKPAFKRLFESLSHLQEPDAGDAATATLARDATLDLRRLKPAELSWHDYLVLLLQVGAEIEHALMVQYLYAAYSLGGEQVPNGQRERVRRWQNTLLTVAREEMGHLVTVQNLLRLAGGPVTLDREDFPLDSAFYPFPFQLEPLSLDSLGLYLYAEMPEPETLHQPDFAGYPTYEAFFARVDPRMTASVAARMAEGHGPRTQAHRVDEIYVAIAQLVADEELIPDHLFDASTYLQQASFDEWGKNYGAQAPDPDADLTHPQAAPRQGATRRERGHAAAAGRRATVAAPVAQPARYPARVIVHRMATRSEAITALEDVAGQGEAPHLAVGTQEPSHFDRFLELYLDILDATEQDGAGTAWAYARAVPVNPTTTRHDPDPSAGKTRITNPHARNWAVLSNLRYRMLLTYLAHTLELPAAREAGAQDARGGLLHRVFGEMYNLKALAGMLVRLPLHGTSRHPDDPAVAAPPFEMPYTLALPTAPAERWRLHEQLLVASQEIIDRLTPHATSEERAYLDALADLDAGSRRWVTAILDSAGAARRSRA